MRALHTAATGMMAQELNVQVISNNIANMRTTGYKRQRAEFQDLLYEHVRRVGTQTSDQGNQLPAGVELGSGVKTVGTPRLMTQGNAAADRQGLDVAIRGEGFFQITLPDGRTAYTRDGSFELDAQGRIVTAQGNVLNPGLTIPQNAKNRSRSTRRARSRRRCRADHDADDRRPDRARDVRQQGRPAGASATTSISRRPPPARRRSARPNQDGFGDLQQGNLEQANVEAVKRNLRPDRRAARLRDERQGHHGDRPDAAIHLADAALRKSHDAHRDLVILLLALGARRRAAAQSTPPRLKPQATSRATSCASATWSRTPASRRTRRSSARPISARPARCRRAPCSTRCGPTG